MQGAHQKTEIPIYNFSNEFKQAGVSIRDRLFGDATGYLQQSNLITEGEGKTLTSPLLYQSFFLGNGKRNERGHFHIIDIEGEET